jgi:hypothetical protein
MSERAMPTGCVAGESCLFTIAPLGCGGAMVVSTPYGGLRTGAVSATIDCTPHILHYI